MNRPDTSVTMIEAKLVSFDEVDIKVKSAINDFRKNDFQLLKSDVHEISITHQIACYLKKHFSGWHVDCEYNRRGKESKTDSRGDDIRPDIIIHERFDQDNPSKKNNLLVIEVKKICKNVKNDRRKLKELTSKTDGEDQYQFGLFLCISDKFPYDVKCELYQNSKHIKTITV